MHKFYQFYLKLHQHIKLFPKSDQHGIGQKIQNLILEMLELTLLAKNKNGTSKLLILDKIDLKLYIAKLFIRFCSDAKIIDRNKYLLLEADLQEIGRMLGGWLKATKEKPRE